MLTRERRDAVYQMIEQEKSVLVKDLCERFDVTNETIRKDLIALEKEGCRGLRSSPEWPA